ncbi:superoxide dismutase family protein [Rubrolithibacter danxiaensis]|uniref:superoxide dismutase family protein n=1 Tax=Rubrolithibacter danxiaensis TaxID=3390805 RepID=UPI003BF86F66
MNLNQFLSGKITLIALFFSLVVFSACSTLKNSNKKEAIATVTATQASTPGEGTVRFTQKNQSVEMKLDISFPSKAGKTVAVHIHEHGDCAEAGNAAHGHWNPTNTKHGKWGTGEYHLGDIGNVQLDQNGKGSLTLKTDKWSIGTGAANDIVGRGIIVHDGTDDYVSQPSGNAGSRIGCGPITLVK